MYVYIRLHFCFKLCSKQLAIVMVICEQLLCFVTQSCLVLLYQVFKRAQNPPKDGVIEVYPLIQVKSRGAVLKRLSVQSCPYAKEASL